MNYNIAIFKFNLPIGPSPAQSTITPFQNSVGISTEMPTTRSKVKDLSKEDKDDSSRFHKKDELENSGITNAEQNIKELLNDNVKVAERIINSRKSLKKEERRQSVPELQANQNPMKLQPFVRLCRLSMDDQQLLQTSLTRFAENKPKLAKELGVLPINNKLLRRKSESIDESESDDNDLYKKNKRERKKPEDDEDYVPDKFSALIGNRKRRKEDKSEPIVTKPKLRRVERKFVPVLEKLTIEELMETNTFDRFNRNVEYVLKSSEDIDFSKISIITPQFHDIGQLYCLFLAEDGVVSEEYLLNRHILQELNTETAKLKILGATEMIPAEKLVRLLHVLEINIKGGDRVSPISDVCNN